MHRFVYINQNLITPSVRGGQVEKSLSNGMALLRLNEKNEEYLKDFIKYSESEALQIAQGDFNFESKVTSEISVKELAAKDSASIPKFAQTKPEGDFNTVLTHNFCDSSSWAISTSDSNWVMSAPSGFKVSVDWAELQFTHDIGLGLNKVLFEYYAWVGNGAESLVQTITFDSLYSIFEYGNSHFHSPAIPPEMPVGLSTVKFDYVKKIVLFGNETPGSLSRIEVKIDTNSELTGTFLKGSFVVSTESI